MAKEVGFVNQGKATGGDASNAKEIGIGLLGYAFMGKAHTNAFKKIPYIYWPPAAIPKLVSVCGSHEDGVREAAARYGYDHYTTDWRKLVTDPEVDVFDNVGPNNLHAEPCIAAAKAGKHVLCEKPLARNAREAKSMWDAVREASVKHMCGFSYRFVPAIRLAKEMLDAGELGEIYHFRASYQQEWVMDVNPAHVWRLSKETSGSGAVGDLGSHIIDLARFLVGEVETISGTTRTFIPERPSADGKGTVKVDVDDAFEAVVRFKNGAVGTLEASRFCAGRKNHMTFEINGSKGSIAFNLEKLNSLQVYFREEQNPQLHGFREVLVTESDHPFYSVWWPHGHILGWEHAHIHEINHFLNAIAMNESVEPYGATFEDGYKAAVICDAILVSAETHTEQQIAYE
ncbi:MAG TPA: Gfo/Idh/MocA family oxidoreductase [Candidatus Acetothermia bacterium]|nr:Gfo/Idh/MocA family oxidoreductase [Candidatus Acetothermia bacterium]